MTTEPGVPGRVGGRPSGAALLYRLARRLVSLILAIFFSKVEASGLESVPRDRPILFAANHPNEMLDPFLIGHFHEGRVNFLAKSTLFGFWPVGWLLRALGGIPVYRQRDAAEQMSRNQDSFRECYDALEAGEAIGIFPEGTSHSQPSLLPLRTGAARIVLTAEAQHRFELGVRLVPVGLHYTHAEEFRSGAVAVFGPAIDPARYAETYGADPQRAVRELTSELEAGLRAITVNFREKDEASLVDQVRKLFRHELPQFTPEQGPGGDYELTRAIVDGYYRALEREPERISGLRQRVEAYFGILRLSGLRPGAADVKATGALRHLARVLPAGLLGLPVALHGLFYNWIPYRIPRWYTEWADLEEVERATFKIGVGAVSFGVAYAVETAAVAWFAGPWVAAVFLATLPVTGLFSLHYFEVASVFLKDVRSFLVFLTDLDLARRLRTMRGELRAELSELAQAYLAGK
jgi:1-acyl-sn-glycerol-3-phosphate acyltransferase